MVCSRLAFRCQGVKRSHIKYMRIYSGEDLGMRLYNIMQKVEYMKSVKSLNRTFPTGCVLKNTFSSMFVPLVYIYYTCN